MTSGERCREASWRCFVMFARGRHLSVTKLQSFPSKPGPCVFRNPAPTAGATQPHNLISIRTPTLQHPEVGLDLRSRTNSPREPLPVKLRKLHATFRTPRCTTRHGRHQDHHRAFVCMFAFARFHYLPQNSVSNGALGVSNRLSPRHPLLRTLQKLPHAPRCRNLRDSTAAELDM